MKVSKQEMMHSLAFRSDRWIDMVGFEMLRGDVSFRINYTITRGQGVMGKTICKGSGFVPIGNILHPSRHVRFRSPLRLESDTWHCINVMIEIHEYELNIPCTRGTNGSDAVRTDSGVRIQYATGLESCPKTNISTGQIAGIVFYCLVPEEEEFLRSRVSRTTALVQADACAMKDACIGNSMAVLPMAAQLDASCTREAHVTTEQGSMGPVVNEESDRTSITLSSHNSTQSRFVLPPIRGVLAPPVRTQEVLKEIPASYK